LSSETEKTQKAPLVVREKVFQNFCTVMNKIGSSTLIPTYANPDTKIYYNPKHSVFVSIVCGSYGLISDFGNEDPKTYFFKHDWITLGIHGKQQDNPNTQDNACRPDFGMTDCDVPKEFTDILHRILNDMFDIKQSQLYGGAFDAEDNKQKLANFTTTHFL